MHLNGKEVQDIINSDQNTQELESVIHLEPLQHKHHYKSNNTTVQQSRRTKHND